MKKRFALLLVAVFCITAVLSGCNLFVTDQRAYYEQTIASMSSKEESNKNITINKEDLIQAFNRYYSTLANYGYQGKELADKIVNMLIDQKVVLAETEKLIVAGDIEITNNDKNEIWQNTYDAMKSMLEDYENQVMKAWKINIPEFTTEETDDTVKYQPYQQKAKIVLVDGEWKIEIIDDSNDIKQSLMYEEDEDDKDGSVVETVIAKLNSYIQNNTIAKEAQKRYIVAVKNAQEGRGLPTDNTSVWKGEVERVYKAVKENKYLNKYNEYLEKGSAQDGPVYSNISVQDVFKYLEQNMKADYEKYKHNLTGFNDKLLSDRASINYIMQDESLGEYFYVSHILVKFDETLFKAIDAALADGTIAQELYDKKRAELIENTCAKEYGKTVEGYTVEKLYNDFKFEMENAKDKMKVFNDFMYKYNEDTGNKNKDFDYVIGTTNSTMVESFTDAARELHEQGEIGAISGMVESEYGIHILIYLGKVENPFTITSFKDFNLSSATDELLEEQINKITNTKLSLLNEKTIFDLVYEKLEKDNFAILEALNVQQLRTQYNTPVIYYGHYSDMC